MRNLKRALSLTLASVMLLGMMVIGSSAAQGYDDVSKDDNVEAIEVLQAIKVMVGDERGFGPERPVNRAEMAVVMALLLNLDYNYYVSTCPFNDVYDWARGPVGACYANGIVSGRGDGVYDPGATVTAVEAASMLMRALGYFRYQNDYEGNFVLSTVKQGSKIGIFDGVGSSADTPMTRNQVAQMVLNALQTGMVEPDGNTLNLATPDGNIYTGKVNYVNVTSNKPFATAISSVRASSIGSQNDSPIVELGEQLYDGKLKLNEYTTDAFERPARYWEFDGKAIGTYVKKELLRAEYTTEVTGKQLYDLLTKDTIEDYEFTIAVDGETTQAVLNGNTENDTFFFSTGNLIRTNTKGVGGTGNGVLTQVFVDPDEPARNARDGRGTVYISVINTYLAQAIDDYDEKREEAEFEVYSLEELASGALVKNTENSGDAPASLKVKNEEINVEDVKEDDIVLVHVAEGEIKEILDPEVIAETELNSFKNNSWVNNGTKYDYADSTSYDPDVLDEYVDDNMKDTVYNLYLDEYGYMIGIDIVDAVTNYLFLTGIDGKTSNLANKTAQGNVIFMDGTMDTVTIKLKDSSYANGDDMTDSTVHPLNSLMNTWCKYTTNTNGDYILTEIARTDVQFNAAKNKAGQSHEGNTNASATGLTRYGTIDKKHVSTLGINEYVGTNTANVKVAYGTDDTVYINVSTGLITATRVAADKPYTDAAFIIDDVDSVTTGVQNANLTALSAFDVWFAAGGGVASKDTGMIDNVAPSTPLASNQTDTKKLDSIANGVYNLFDADGALIAAIVVGEDDSATTGYAYVISDEMEQESYDKSKTEWTWSRKVVVNGEITEITEITDGKTPEISETNMIRGQWYEVKYKADGTVKSADLIGWDEDRDNSVDSVDSEGHDRVVVGEFLAQANASAINGADGKFSKFIGLVRKVEAAVEENDTVVLATDLTGRNLVGGVSVPTCTDNYSSIRPNNNNVTPGTNVITAEGNTLWIESSISNQKDGFAVRNDAKVVLVQDTHTIRNGRVIKTDVMANEYEYTQTGKEALSKMVKDLMDNQNFSGFISAVFDGGVATSVVVWDQTPENIDTGSDPSIATITVNDARGGIDTLTGLRTGVNSVNGGNVYTMTLKSGYTATRTGAGSLVKNADGTWTITAPANGSSMTVTVTKVGSQIDASGLNIYDVNVLLDEDDVAINANNGNWNPSDSGTETLNIPEGRTLRIVGGSLNTSSWANNITGSGTLIVDRRFTTKGGQTFECTIEARDLVVSSAGATFEANVTVTNEMDIGSGTVNINNGATVDVAKKLTGSSGTVNINTDGTLKVNEDENSAITIAGITINNLSGHTLRAGGVLSNVTLVIGNARNVGTTVINTMQGGSLTLVNGSLEVSGALLPATVTKSAVVDGFTVKLASTSTVNNVVADAITGTTDTSELKATYTAGSTQSASDFTTSQPANAPTITAPTYEAVKAFDVTSAGEKPTVQKFNDAGVKGFDEQTEEQKAASLKMDAYAKAVKAIVNSVAPGSVYAFSGNAGVVDSYNWIATDDADKASDQGGKTGTIGWEYGTGTGRILFRWTAPEKGTYALLIKGTNGTAVALIGLGTKTSSGTYGNIIDQRDCSGRNWISGSAASTGLTEGTQYSYDIVEMVGEGNWKTLSDVKAGKVVFTGYFTTLSDLAGKGDAD